MAEKNLQEFQAEIAERIARIGEELGAAETEVSTMLAGLSAAAAGQGSEAASSGLQALAPLLTAQKVACRELADSIRHYSVPAGAAVAPAADDVELLNVTLGSIREGLISTDGSGKVLLLNATAGELTGWDCRAAVGEDIRIVMRLKDLKTRAKVDDPVALIFANGRLTETEFVLVNVSDETERTIACRGTPMRDGAGAIIGTVIVFRDITETKLMEDELFRARKLESVGVLAGGIAHDFNNILTGIVTNLFMAKTCLPTGSDAYDLIAEAEKAGFRASKLTKQLLTFAKGGTPVKEHASLRELIEDSVGFCLSGSDVNCRLEIPEDLDMVEIDRGQIDQVLNNLIINADQAMPEGGTIVIKAENITISDEISPNTEARLPLEPGRYIKVAIQDQGVGIPREHLSRIFDPYFTTKPNSTGLGLTTVYSIVKKHGGLITVKSHEAGGTTFIFYLPSTANAAVSKGGELEAAGQRPGRILVMDDEQVIRIVVEKLLRKFGYEVVCVTNGAEAIECYKKAQSDGHRFDVVIMDLTIPGGMGGKEAVKRLLAHDPSAQVIVASGYSSDPIMAQYREHGFVGVISKPFNIEDYLRVIKQVMTGVKDAGPATAAAADPA